MALLEEYEPAAVRFLENIVWERADGYHVRDADGNVYLDFTSGAMITNSGHNNRAIIDAIAQQLQTGIFSTYLFPNKPRALLHERLSRLIPHGYRSVFLTTGAEAIETSIKIARIHAKKKLGNDRGIIVSFRNAFHGKTMATTAIGGVDALKYWISDGIQAEISVQVPFPNCEYEPDSYRFSDTLDHLAQMDVRLEDVAGFLIEPYQGGSCSFVPGDYARDLAAFCRDTDKLLICDEVQSGVGRTGRMWAYEHLGVVPDIFVAAKGLAAGLPLSAVVGRRDLFDACEPGTFNSTHSGNPVCCAAAVANLDYVVENNLVEHVQHVGATLMARLRELQRQHPQLIAHVLGEGLAVALHLSQDFRHVTAELLRALHANGLLVLSPGGVAGTTFKFVPPLIIDDQGVSEGCDIIEKTFAQIAADLPGNPQQRKALFA